MLQEAQILSVTIVHLLGILIFLLTTLWLALAHAPARAEAVEEVVKALRALPPSQRKTALEEGARKEGEVVWYTSMSLTDFPKIVGAFEKSTPYVKVRANRLAQSSLMPKIETEARAGRSAVDVVASAPVEMWELKQRNYSASYLSPELKAFPAGSFDPQGYWSSTEVTALVLAFNTQMVPPEMAPRQTVLALKVPRMTLRKGIKQIPRHQELYKKEFVFVNPASIGPNLNELIASYQQIFDIR